MLSYALNFVVYVCVCRTVKKCLDDNLEESYEIMNDSWTNQMKQSEHVNKIEATNNIEIETEMILRLTKKYTKKLMDQCLHN